MALAHPHAARDGARAARAEPLPDDGGAGGGGAEWGAAPAPAGAGARPAAGPWGAVASTTHKIGVVDPNAFVPGHLQDPDTFKEVRPRRLDRGLTSLTASGGFWPPFDRF